LARLSELAGNCVVPHVPDVLQVNWLAAMVTSALARAAAVGDHPGRDVGVLACGRPVSVVAEKSPAAKGVV
jgi:hypothetical protein